MIDISVIIFTYFLIFTAYRLPLAIVPIYLFLSNFFVIDLPFLNITSSWLFVGHILAFGFYHFLKKLGQKEITYIHLLPSLFFILTPLLISLFHFFIWDEFPSLYLKTALKSCWGLVILFIPFNRKDLIWSLIISAAVLLFSLLLVSYDSIPYFLENQLGLGRKLTPSIIDGVLSAPVYGLKGQFPFIMDDNTQQNMSVLSFSLILLLQISILQKRKIFISFFSLCVIFMTYIFFVNQYMSNLMALIGSFLIITLSSLSYGLLSKKIIITFPIFLIFLLIGLHLKYPGALNEQIYKFKMAKFGSTETRVTVFYKGLKRLQNNALIGSGAPRDHINSKTPSKINITGHSTLLDNFLSFGIPLGFMANFIYFFPFLLLLFTQNLKKKLNYLEFSFFAAFFCLSFYQVSANIFARFAITQGAYILMSLILFLFLYSDKENA